MDRQSGTIVVDEAQIPELIHEMTDSRTGRADHLRQRILIYCGNCGFVSIFLAEMSQQQNPGQTLLDRVEQLINEIRFVADVARKQMLLLLIPRDESPD